MLLKYENSPSKAALMHRKESKITLIIKASTKVIKHPFDDGNNTTKCLV